MIPALRDRHENEHARLDGARNIALPPIDVTSDIEHFLQICCQLFDVSYAVLTVAGHEAFHADRSGETERRLSPGELALCERVRSTGRPLFMCQRPDGPSSPATGWNVDTHFFAGLPLPYGRAEEQGTLSLIDHVPRVLTLDEKETLERMASLAGALLRERRSARTIARLAHANLVQTARLQEQSAALAHNKKIFDRSSAVARIGVWECDLVNGDALRWTDGVYDIFELPRGVPVKRELAVQFYTPESRKEMNERRSKAIAECGGFTLDAQIVTAKGNVRWMRLTADVETKNGVAVRIFGMKQDITEEKALWEKTRYLAEFDELTGLANRASFHAALSRSCREGCEEAERVGALFLIDLDGFKQINDVFGHSAGDVCLGAVARRLTDIGGKAKAVARVGGDEFAVFLVDANLTAITQMAESIVDEMRRPIRSGKHVFTLGASVGIAVPDKACNAQPGQLYKQADIALYAAKQAGKNTFRIFTADMKSEADRRFEAVRDVTKALAENHVELQFQPKIRLADRQLCGFETQLRARLHDGTAIDDAAFAIGAGDPKLRILLDEWHLETVLRQAAEWRAAALGFGMVAINLSAAQAGDPHLVMRLLDRLAAHAISPETLEIELSEDIFFDDSFPAIQRNLDSLAQSGIRVVLDNFGRRYAPIGQLRSTRLDAIKFDSSLVRALPDDKSVFVLLQSTASLAQALEIEMIADGIETSAQASALASLGCQFGQGPLFSKPIRAQEAAQWCSPAAA